MSGPLAQLLALVIEIESNRENDAEFIARLDAQDAIDKGRLEAEYPTVDDDDPEERSTFYIS